MALTSPTEAIHQGKLVQFVERTACLLCDRSLADCADEAPIRIEDHESRLGTFDIVTCGACELGFTNPYPTEATALHLYEGATTTDYDEIKESFVDRLKDRLSQRLVRKLASGIDVRRALDFSTGNGRFAMSAAKVFTGASVDAVDVQPQPPPLLAGSTRVRYLHRDAFAAENVRYDLIVLRHVLEHHHDPVALVTELGKRLAPGGVLYIEVPNLDSACAKLFAKNWKGHYVPRHIFHFTERSLREVVTSAGLVAEMGKNEMPLMGNTAALLAGVSVTNPIAQLAGVALHPFQLALEKLSGSATCVNASCRLP